MSTDSPPAAALPNPVILPAFNDPQQLAAGQYRNASNLNARVEVHRRFSVNAYGWFRWVFDHLTLPPTARVLELGCGPALFWVENLARVPAGWDVTLTDLSPGMCETAQRNLGAAADRFTFEVVDAQSIPYAVAAFDAVIANHMLYHVPDRPRAFAEIRRVLRPGGRFYATTIGEANLRELDEWNRHVGLGAAIMANRDVAALFGLESGAVQLAPWFSEIRRDMYDDGLAITETPLLKAYVRSALDGAQAAAYADALTAFDRFVDEELARCGILGITKSAGLFQAVR